jgi:hypothetical protein
MGVTIDRADITERPFYKPQRITDAQAAILWAMREINPSDPKNGPGRLSLRNGGKGVWNCGWSCHWTSPFGPVPISVKKPTMRALLDHQLVAPAVQADELDLDRPPAVTCSNVVAINFRRPQETPRARLAKFLMQLSTLVSGDALEQPAHAALIVLTGPHGNEITSVGHRSWAELRDACQAAAGITIGPDGQFVTRGYAVSTELEITKAGRIALLAQEEAAALKACAGDWSAHCRVTEEFRPKWRELGRAGRW